MHGYFAGRKIAYVDLSSGRIRVERINEQARLMLLGGRGLNMLVLLKYGSGGQDALDASAPLILGNGLLSGIPGLSLARTSVSGISPETGLLGDSNVGGWFCAALRRTAFDHVVITGKFERPGIVVLEGDTVRLESGEWLWGKDSFETSKRIKERYGQYAESVHIGPGGENLVRFAQVRTRGRHGASRTGLGCTMGSKRLKAVVAKGPRRSALNDLYDKKGFVEATRRLGKAIMSASVIKHLSRRGTPYLYDLHSRLGLIRSRNATAGPGPGARALRTSKLLENYYRGSSGCFSCRIRCQHSFTVPGGKYAGTRGDGIEYGTLGTLGSVLGICDPGSVLAINHKLNAVGIDSCSFGNILAAAIELFKKGEITTRDTEGLELEWGDEELVMRMVDLVVERRGFGSIIADGAVAFCDRFGKPAEDAMVWGKRLPQSDPVDVRAHAGFALGVATATRGADHLRSRPTLEALRLDERRLKEIYGVAVSSVPGSWAGKAEAVRVSEILYAVADSVGICKFLVKFNSPDLLGLEHLAQIIYYATGVSLTPSQLALVGERVSAIERLWLSKRTGGKNLNGLPLRYFEPMPAGKFKGARIDRRRFAQALKRFCTLSGLDYKTGAPVAETLRSLGIDDSLLELV